MFQFVVEVGVDHMTIAHSPRLTSDDSESFNRLLNREIGNALPDVWAFVGRRKNN